MKKIIFFLIFLFMASTSYAEPCLNVQQYHTAGINSDTATIVNGCVTKVNYTYCVEDGFFSCSEGKFGSGSVRAGKKDMISVAGSKSLQPRVYFAECPVNSSQNEPLPVDQRWSGYSLSASCR